MRSYLSPVLANRISLAGFLLCVSVAFVLMTWQLTFFRFSVDHARTITDGQKTRDAGFMVNHGATNSRGVHVSPYHYYFMGAVTSISESPVFAVAVLILINYIALVAAVLFFYNNLPPPYAFLSSLLLCTSPAYLTMATMLWEPSLLPPAMVLFMIKLSSLIKDSNESDFIWVAVASALAQAHMSAFFLYPMIVILAVVYRKSISLTGYLKALGLMVFLSSPYLYHLLIERHIFTLLKSGEGDIERNSSVIYALFDNASIRYFTTYFGTEFQTFLQRASGDLGKHLHTASAGLSISFLAGWVFYIVYVISRRSLFSSGEQSHEMTSSSAVAAPHTAVAAPPVFLASGFIVSYMALVYFVVKVRPFPHYFLILFPFITVVAAWPLWRIWKFRAGKAITIVIVGSSMILLILIYSTLKSSGGYPGAPTDYGPTYNILKSIEKELIAKTPEGYVPIRQWYGEHFGALAISMRDFEALREERLAKGFPEVYLVTWVWWDGRDWGYRWMIKALNVEFDIHRKGIDYLISGVSKETVIAANWKLEDASGARRENIVLFKTVQDLHGDINYVAVNLGTPISLVEHHQIKAHRCKGDPACLGGAYRVYNQLRDMLLDPAFGLIFSDGFTYLFQRGAEKLRDQAEYTRLYMTFDGAEQYRSVGTNTWDRVEEYRWVRQAWKDESEAGQLVYGPYITLKQGQYTANFAISAERIEQGELALLDIAADQGRKILAKKILTSDDFSDDNKREVFALPFEITESQYSDVEFRVYYYDRSDISVAKITVDFSKDAFHNTLKVN